MQLFDSLEKRKELRKGTTRRRFVYTLLAGIGVYYGHKWWRMRPKPVSQRVTEYLTSNQRFFNISIDPSFRPDVSLDNYKLIVINPSGNMNSYAYADLAARPSQRIVRTLMCVGNPVGGTGIGNAEWKVISLSPILSENLDGQGISDIEDLEVCFYGLDGFYSSVPFSVANDPNTFLALEMNGEPLPRKHGFPLRVLIPDKYGMKQPRWLEKIVIGRSVPSGYWERRGWSWDCEIKMNSRIDSVRPMKRSDEWIVKGIAFCGWNKVGKVELSDDQEIWQKAHLRESPRNGAWSTWEYAWRPKKPGPAVLSVRVTDEAGNRQVESYSGSFRSGSTGLHSVVFDSKD